MLEYLYLLDYKYDGTTGLYIVKPDLTIDEIEDLQARDEVNCLKEAFPRHRVRVCFDILGQENGYDTAKLYLESKLDDTLIQDDCLYAKEAIQVLARYHNPEPFPHLSKLTSYRSMNSDDLITVPQLAIHASVYGIADKYGIEGLKETSKLRLKAALQNEGCNPIAQQSYKTGLVQEIEAAIRVAWEPTPDIDHGIRALFLDYVSKNAEVLLPLEAFKHVIRQTPQFACDLLARSLTGKSLESPPNYRMVLVGKRYGKRHDIEVYPEGERTIGAEIDTIRHHAGSRAISMTFLIRT